MATESLIQKVVPAPDQILLQISEETEAERADLHDQLLEIFRTDENSTYNRIGKYPEVDITIPLHGTRVRIFTKFRVINGIESVEVIAENLDIPPKRNIKLTGGYTINTPVIFADAIYRTLQGDRVVFTNTHEAGGGTFEEQLKFGHRFRIVRDLVLEAANHTKEMLTDPQYDDLPWELWDESVAGIAQDQMLRDEDLLANNLLRKITGVRKISGAPSGRIPFGMSRHLWNLTMTTFKGGNLSEALRMPTKFSEQTAQQAFMTDGNQEAVLRYLASRFSSSGIFFEYATTNVPEAAAISSITRLQILQRIPKLYILTSNDHTINNRKVAHEMRRLAGKGIPVQAYEREHYPDSHVPEFSHKNLREAAESIGDFVLAA